MKTKWRWEYEEGALLWGDCLMHMDRMYERREKVDLVVGSPPYEDARLYLEDGEDLGISRTTNEWVEWMIEIFKAALAITDGLVAFVVGHGKGGMQWSGAPALLMADLIRSGVNLRSPVWYKRNGIMGGGGKDWLRPDLETIICATNGRIRLPWSDNTACGHPPKFGPGGEVSHYGKSRRVNAPSSIHRNKDGTKKEYLNISMTTDDAKRIRALAKKEGISLKQAALRLNLGHTRFDENGKPLNRWKKGSEGGANVTSGVYVPPEKTNPGNVIDVGAVGGGHMGSNIAHENEAAYPVQIPNFFVRSFCPPNGVVCDPFCGSGTTIQAAIENRRRFIGIDLRLSQIKLCHRRIKQARLRKGFDL